MSGEFIYLTYSLSHKASLHAAFISQFLLVQVSHCRPQIMCTRGTCGDWPARVFETLY